MFAQWHIFQPLTVLFSLRIEEDFLCRAPNPEAIKEKLTDLTPYILKRLVLERHHKQSEIQVTNCEKMCRNNIKPCIFIFPINHAPWTSLLQGWAMNLGAQRKGAETAWKRGQRGPGKTVVVLTSFTPLGRQGSSGPAFVETGVYPETLPVRDQRRTLVDLTINVYTGRTPIKRTWEK